LFERPLTVGDNIEGGESIFCLLIGNGIFDTLDGLVFGVDDFTSLI
jgi:hypothetical protein